MRHGTNLALIPLLLSLAALTFPDLSHGALDVLIQPSEDGSQTYFTVSWDSLDGSADLGTGSQSFGDPVDHSDVGDSIVIWTLWSDFGDYKFPATNEVFLRQGTPGYLVNPVGFGLYLDDDFERGPGDDFGITFSGGSFPSSGSFLVRTPTYGGGFLSMWKPGVHTGPAGSSISVTTVAFVPEPSSAGLWGLSVIWLSRHRRRHGGIHAGAAA